MYNNRSMVLGCLAGILFIVNVFAFSNFTNYQSVIQVNDIAVSGNMVWAASSGGLICLDLKKQTKTLLSDGFCFPDLNLTAIDMDSKGNIWIGTKLGYLYKRTPSGNCTVYDSYYGSQWDIRDIQVCRDYVFVASSKGLSLFDPNKEEAIRNATSIDTSGDPSVYSIAIHNDSLYAGCNNSFNAVNIYGNNLLNFDKAKWNSFPAEKPVTSFVDSSGKLIPRSQPAALAGSVFYNCTTFADSTFIYHDTNKVFAIADKITRMIVDADQNLWFGTEQNFLYRIDSKGSNHQFTMPGLTFSSISRVFSAANGTVWLLSTVKDLTWWEGINAFDGKTWALINRYTVPAVGNFSSGGTNFKGICQDRNENIWFGTEGYGVKFYDIHKNEWSRYYVAGYAFPEIRHVDGGWSYQDAIVQDSSGYMWFSNDDPFDLIKTGPLVCYDATEKQSPSFRRFFPDGDIHHAVNITTMSVDSKGRILAGTVAGKLLVVSHNGNPIKDGVTVELDQSDLAVADICSTPDSATTWIATGKGLLRYQSGSGAPVLNTTVQTSLTCVAAENDNVLWLGTSSAGLIRYDIQKDAKTILDMSKGLVSNTINSLSIDKKGGYLWIGTAEGLSRYYLGHSETPVVGNTSIVAYPNPLSLSNPNHRMIVFKHCAPDARVLIYSINGTLVKQLSREANALNPLDDNTFESTLYWVPPKKLAPGAYYFVGYPKKPNSTKKLIITP